MSNIDNQVVLITGANRGIGLSLLKTFYDNNLLVVGTFRTDSGKKIIDSVIKDKSRGMSVKLDVTSKDDLTKSMSEIREKFGHVNVLINNAGITKDNLFMRMKEEEWGDVIETNLNSVFRITKECVKDMVKNKYGRIINISSIIGISGNAGQANYSASKSAMYGFTKSLAKELASRGITVNSISPGFIQTDMTANLSEEQKNNITKSIPLARLGECEDIANLALFLASKKSSYITGENINVNGGLYM